MVTLRPSARPSFSDRGSVFRHLSDSLQPKQAFLDLIGTAKNNLWLAQMATAGSKRWGPVTPSQALGLPSAVLGSWPALGVGAMAFCR